MPPDLCSSAPAILVLRTFLGYPAVMPAFYELSRWAGQLQAFRVSYDTIGSRLCPILIDPRYDPLAGRLVRIRVASDRAGRFRSVLPITRVGRAVRLSVVGFSKECPEHRVQDYKLKIDACWIRHGAECGYLSRREAIGCWSMTRSGFSAMASPRSRPSYLADHLSLRSGPCPVAVTPARRASGHPSHRLRVWPSTSARHVRSSCNCSACRIHFHCEPARSLIGSRRRALAGAFEGCETDSTYALSPAFGRRGGLVHVNLHVTSVRMVYRHSSTRRQGCDG